MLSPPNLSILKSPTVLGQADGKLSTLFFPYPCGLKEVVAVNDVS
jgi:hypothetical protein